MSCVVPGCKSHTSELEVFKDKKSFHRFPVDPQIHKKWINNIRPNRPNWQPTKYSRICSLHFEPHCYRNVSPQVSARKFLHSYAVPTIFPNQPAYSHQKIPKKRMHRMRKEGDNIRVIGGQSAPGQDLPKTLTMQESFTPPAASSSKENIISNKIQDLPKYQMVYMQANFIPPMA